MMDYSRFTVPKEIQDFEEELRRNPNAKRPRKMAPRVIFSAVIEREQRERAVAEAATEEKQAAASYTPKGSKFVSPLAPVSATPANSPHPEPAATPPVALAAPSDLHAHCERIVSSAVDVLKNEDIPQHIRDSLRDMVRHQVFPDHVPAAPAGPPATPIPDDDDIALHLLRSLQGIIRRHRELPASSHASQTATTPTNDDDRYLMSGAIQRFPSDPPLSPRSPSPTTIPRHHSASTSSSSSSSSPPSLPARLATAGVPPLPAHPAPPTHPSQTLPSFLLPTTPLADMAATPSPRIGPRADSWTYAEAMAAASVLGHIFLEHAEAQRLRADDKYRLAAEMLAANYNVRRTWASVKNWWFREGRGVTGLDERVLLKERVGAGAARVEGQRRRRRGERERGEGKGRKRVREE